ncbi:hypothetical protein ACFX2I_025323 [Malus domestica]
MICAPFVGVNHHWSNVLLGYAFLLDEKTATFEWLFEAFLESMGNRKPTTIFIDQCQAMANAIMVVFSGTCHHLCTWHISTNATRNIPTLYGIPEFKRLFNKCLDGCQTELEFQHTWDAMIEEFNVAQNKWLKGLYAICEKWCPVFSQDAFSVRIKSTQISESMNNVFHRMSTKMMTLTEFVLHYEKQANGMRSKELEETFRCKQEKTKPPSSGGPSHTANANARSPSTNQFYPTMTMPTANSHACFPSPNHLYPTLSLLTTNAHARFPSSNQFYPTTRLSTTNVQTSLPLSNQSPNYSWSCSPPNFTFTNVLQSQNCMTHLNQDVFPYDFEEHQDACNS